ncbi:hypothetical protein VTH82DRAFT_3707 [Thermothelomyces myriococcoides]
MKPTTVLLSLVAIAAAARLPSAGPGTDTNSVDIVARHHPSHQGQQRGEHNEVIPPNGDETQDLDTRGFKLKPPVDDVVNLGNKIVKGGKKKDKHEEEERLKKLKQEEEERLRKQKQKEQEEKQKKEKENNNNNNSNNNSQPGKHKNKDQQSDAAALADLDVAILLAGLVGTGIVALF